MYLFWYKRFWYLYLWGTKGFKNLWKMHIMKNQISEFLKPKQTYFWILFFYKFFEVPSYFVVLFCKKFKHMYVFCNLIYSMPCWFLHVSQNGLCILCGSILCLSARWVFITMLLLFCYVIILPTAQQRVPRDRKVRWVTQFSGNAACSSFSSRKTGFWALSGWPFDTVPSEPYPLASEMPRDQSRPPLGPYHRDLKWLGMIADIVHVLQCHPAPHYAQHFSC